MTVATPQPATTQAIPLSKLVQSTTNPRKAFDEGFLRELAASIKEQGILQPLLVRPRPHSVFEVVAGEQRRRAAGLAGLAEVPCYVRELSDDEVLAVQLVENLQRADLHPLEEADGYRQLVAKGLDAARIAERVGRSVGYVYDRVKLLSLTKAAQEAFRDGRITTGHAIVLARLGPKDQARAMDVDTGGLWQDEHTLFDPEADRRFSGQLKVRSVRELQGWIDTHVLLEAKDVDPMLFPDSALQLKTAAEEQRKVVRITHDTMTPEAAKDGPRPVLGRSWKRADGQRGSKECDRSVIGEIVIGPGRGQVLRVCTDKQHCTVHWGELIRERKKREKAVAASASTGEDRDAIRRQKEAEAEARRAAAAARWKAALPAVLEAVAAAVKKAGAGADGPAGRVILELYEQEFHRADKRTRSLVPIGKTAEDLVRYVAFQQLAADGEWTDQASFAKSVQAFGVDVKKIVDQAAPAIVAKCRKCGCTEAKACKGGCSWTQEPDLKTGLGLCSSCAIEAAVSKASRKPSAPKPKPKPKAKAKR